MNEKKALEPASTAPTALDTLKEVAKSTAKIPGTPTEDTFVDGAGVVSMKPDPHLGVMNNVNNANSTRPYPNNALHNPNQDKVHTPGVNPNQPEILAPLFGHKQSASCTDPAGLV